MAIDILMKFVKGGNAIAAGSQADLDPKDKFLSDFEIGKFFEVDDFSFGAGLDDMDSSSGKNNQTTQQGPYDPNKPGSQEPKKSKVRFTRFMNDPKFKKTTDDGYPVDLDPFEFTRQMDQASPQLFEMCCNSESFASATVVKRKFGGEKVSGHCFLRIDFTDVLVIGVDWDSGDVIKEKCKFVCRQVKIQYRPQLADGTLDSAVPGTWSYKAPPGK